MIDGLEAAPLYRTEAVSDRPQPPYLNTVLVGSTRAPAVDLLAVAKAIEHAAGRRRAERHAPRRLDLDLLLYEDLISDAPELTLPHPRLRARRFALEPLAALEPDLRLPPDGRTVRELLAALPPNPRVEKLGPWLGAV